MLPKPQIKAVTRSELTAVLAGWDQPSFRVDQVCDWVYRQPVRSFDEMTNLPARLRQLLAEHYDLDAVRSLRTRHATDTTEKFLFELADGALIETVLIPATPGLTTSSDRYTLCLSTQVGCAFGCRFCASGLDGIKRNLSAAEIVDQVIQAQRLSGQTVNNVVVMGMGEPLANYDQLLQALTILNAPWALGIGARRITVSTVGLVPEIRRLASEPLQLRLAISLHGATDEVRGRLMPVNRKYPLAELMAACEFYCDTRQRRLTFEYLLIADVNDGLDQADRLGIMARRLQAKVNLIPYNPVPGLPWNRPDHGRSKLFRHTVRRHGVTVTLRTEKGTDINAACGQLRLKHHRQEVGVS